MRRDRFARTLLIPAILLAIALTPQLGVVRNVTALANYNVKIQSLFFKPSSITIHSGDIVTWNNTDPLIYEMYFAYTNGTSVGLSPFLKPGDTYSRVFPRCGSFQYLTIGSEVTAIGTIKVLIQGDVNGDGKVDIVDLASVGAAFGSNPPDPNWNPKADLNQDGTINIIDLVLVASHFGQICAP